jgi:hypothetical protein
MTLEKNVLKEVVRCGGRIGKKKRYFNLAKKPSGAAHL